MFIKPIATVNGHFEPAGRRIRAARRFVWVVSIAIAWFLTDNTISTYIFRAFVRYGIQHSENTAVLRYGVI